MHAITQKFFGSHIPTAALILGNGIGSSRHLLMESWPTLNVEAVEKLPQMNEIAKNSFCAQGEVIVGDARVGIVLKGGGSAVI